LIHKTLNGQKAAILISQCWRIDIAAGRSNQLINIVAICGGTLSEAIYSTPNQPEKQKMSIGKGRDGFNHTWIVVRLSTVAGRHPSRIHSNRVLPFLRGNVKTKKKTLFVVDTNTNDCKTRSVVHTSFVTAPVTVGHWSRTIAQRSG
jgi:hypothetical protein